MAKPCSQRSTCSRVFTGQRGPVGLDWRVLTGTTGPPPPPAPPPVPDGAVAQAQSKGSDTDRRESDDTFINPPELSGFLSAIHAVPPSLFKFGTASLAPPSRQIHSAVRAVRDPSALGKCSSAEPAPGRHFHALG